MKYLRVNERIRVPKVRLIDPDGKQLGVISRYEALKIAMEKGLDIVEIVPTVFPPICKIMDYGKYKYEQSKSKKHKHKVSQLKEIKLGLKIQEADLNVKLRHATAFLTHGNKVKVTLRFRGREIVYAARGKEILLNFAKSLDPIGIPESKPQIDARVAHLLLIPRK